MTGRGAAHSSSGTCSLPAVPHQSFRKEPALGGKGTVRLGVIWVRVSGREDGVILVAGPISEDR
jgi:hypothetical protein